MSGQEALDLALAQRVADAIGQAAETYRANDPERSRSGTPFALGRRQGRRDAAIDTIVSLFGGTITRERAEWMIAEGHL